MKPNQEDESEGSTVMVSRPKTTSEPQEQEQQQDSGPLVQSVEPFIEHEVAKLVGHSRLFAGDDGSCPDIAAFHRNEIMTCTLLGNGAFSEVYQIFGFRPKVVACEPQVQNAREYLQDSAITEHGQCRYVLKHLRRDILRHKAKFVHAASDLVMESKFLSQLDHPNIVKLRGWSGGISSYGDGSHDGFFVVLDRLDQTLSQRIAQWQKIPFCRQQVFSKKLLDYREKIDIGLQIAGALKYLHERDIIFRDLKPDNIGFRGNTIQIFDFGLCRELPEVHPDDSEVFHMSGVGTRRYMAPEIFNTQHYNLKADVYSWTIVFQTMLSLHRPFETCDAALHKLLVCQDGLRPTIMPNWPSELRQLCKDGWAANPDDRPSMKQVCETLEQLNRKADDQLLPAPNFLEKSLELFDKLCDTNPSKFNQQAGNVLRLLEMQMVGGTAACSINFRERNTTEYPHFQHLRSAYL